MNRSKANRKRNKARTSQLRLEQLEARQLLTADTLGGEIHGTKWSDLNGNGEREPDEPGLAGVTIYADVNGNGMLDAEDPSTITMADDPATDYDESGRYSLQNVSAGNYAIREVVPWGFEQTFPEDQSHQVIIEPGYVIDGVNFGNAPVGTGQLQGVKWHDVNRNGIREDAEGPIAGIEIYVDLNENQKWDPNEPWTTTQHDGAYKLHTLPEGKYTVREIVPDDMVQTFPDSGAHEVKLEAGDILDGLDFGNARDPSGEVHGIKYRDDNGNGQHDDNEPGIAGITIYSDLNRNGRRDRGEPATLSMLDNPDTRENERGRYWLGGLRPGTHWIAEVVPFGFEQTAPDGGFHKIDVGASDPIQGIDFGNRPRTGSIHGIKFRDDNGNGKQDDHEPGIAGIGIYSDLNRNGQHDSGEPISRSMQDNEDTPRNERGHYWLEGLRPGVHIVREIVPNGFEQTAPQEGFHRIVVEPDGRVEGIDFGNRPITGSIYGVKFQDNNGNGIREDHEPGLAGVVIYSDLNGNGMRDAGEPATRTLPDNPDTLRDETGTYWLEGLRPGTHFIHEVVPAGYTQTAPSDGFHKVEVPPDGKVDGVDFGNRPNPGSVHGRKWRDDNGNGKRDRGEPAYANVVIYSDLNGNGRFDRGEPATKSMVDDPVTDFDEAGMYWLEGLRPGKHTIREVVPKGFRQTHPTEAYEVELAPGGGVDGLDFFNQSHYCPGDTDRDGDVDFKDFLALSAAFGKRGGWEDGDFNGDGVVAFADFLDLSRNYGKSNTVDVEVIDAVLAEDALVGVA